MQRDAEYVCHSCGETIVVPVDASAGRVQSYVEDCPVCCRPHVLLVEFDAEGEPHLTAEPE